MEKESLNVNIKGNGNVVTYSVKDTKKEPIFSEFENLLLNLSAGLKPENLSNEEISLMEANLGLEWFEKLGYSQPEYRKPSKD